MPCWPCTLRQGAREVSEVQQRSPMLRCLWNSRAPCRARSAHTLLGLGAPQRSLESGRTLGPLLRYAHVHGTEARVMRSEHAAPHTILLQASAEAAAAELHAVSEASPPEKALLAGAASGFRLAAALHGVEAGGQVLLSCSAGRPPMVRGAQNCRRAQVLRCTWCLHARLAMQAELAEHYNRGFLMTPPSGGAWDVSGFLTTPRQTPHKDASLS